MTVKVKICGITQLDDLRQAALLGADALGFVCYPKSKRAIDVNLAQALVKEVPAFVKSVVLLVNPNRQEVIEIIQRVKPDLIQFHGDESAEFCESFDYPYLKAVRVGAPLISTPEEILNYLMQYPLAKGFIFDSFTPEYGGSGISFDLTLLDLAFQEIPKYKLIIAGGINKERVRSLLQNKSIYAVDLSSSLEIKPGVKSKEKMEQFMQAIY